MSRRMNLRLLIACAIMGLVAGFMFPAAGIPDDPLHKAAELGDAVQVRRLLAERPDQVDVRNNRGETPLHLAARYGHKDAARVLLEKGADANARDRFSHTPLHAAATSGRGELVPLLVSHGADLDATDLHGRTPLFIAATQKSEEIIDRIPGFLALTERCQEIVDLLIAEGAKRDIFVASSLGWIDEVSKLLMTDPQLATARAPDGQTALHWAAKYGRDEVVELLLSRGASASAEAERPGHMKGITALHDAAAGGHVRVAELLLKRGTDVDVNANGGFGWLPGYVQEWTPLHWAAYNGGQTLTELLIREGADVDARDADGETPLHWAVRQGHRHVVESLLRNKATIVATDSRCVSPLIVAAEAGRADIVSLLLAHGAPVDAWSAASLGDRNRLETMMKNDSRLIVQRGPSGRTLLHLAARTGQQEVMERLLACGTDANVLDKNNVSPLYEAARGGHTVVVEQLLARGAEVDQRGYGRATLLHRAVRGTRESQTSCSRRVRNQTAATRWGSCP